MRYNAIGIIWKLIACASFAGINVIVRYLTWGAENLGNALPSDVVVFFKSLLGCITILPLLVRSKFNKPPADRIKLHIIRVIFAVLGVLLFYIAISKMPLVQALALQFTGPIFTVIGAKVFLREKIGILRLLGIVIGFLGSAMITRPDREILLIGTSNIWIIFFPMISAVCFVICKLTTRRLASLGEDPIVLAIYLPLFMVPISGIFAFFNWQTPNAVQLAYLLLLGALSSLAHISSVKAFVYSEVTFLAPIGCTKLIFTAILGFLLFGEFPTEGLAIYGIILILGSVFIVTNNLNKSERNLSNFLTKK